MKIEGRRQLHIRKGKSGKPRAWPAANLMNAHPVAKLEGKGWDKHYKAAFAKLGQIHATIDTDIQPLLQYVADYYEKQYPYFFQSQAEGGVGIPKAQYIAQLGRDPQQAGAILRGFGEKNGLSAFTAIGDIMVSDPYAENSALGGSSYADKQEVGNRLASSGGTADIIGEAAAPVAAMLPGGAWWATAAQQGPQFLAAREALAEGAKLQQNERPGVGHLLDVAKAQGTHFDATRNLLRARETGVGLEQAQAAYATAERAVHDAHARLPDQVDRQSATTRRLRESAQGKAKLQLGRLLSGASAPKFVPGLYSALDVLADTTGKDRMLAQINTEKRSVFEEDLKGQVFAQPVTVKTLGPDGRSVRSTEYKAGQEITPEIQQELQNSNITDVVSTAPSTWGQLALRYGDTGATAVVESVMGQKAAQMFQGGAQGLRYSAAGQGAYNRLPARVQSAVDWGIGRGTPQPNKASRMSQLADKWVPGAKRARVNLRAILRKSGKPQKLLKFLGKLKGVKFLGKLAPIIGVGTGAYDTYAGLTDEGQQAIDDQLKQRWIDSYHKPDMLSRVGSDLADIGQGFIGDITPAQAAMADYPPIQWLGGGVDARAQQRKEFLEQYQIHQDLDTEYAKVYGQYRRALPGALPESIEDLAHSAATDRVLTAHGQAPTERDMTPYQREMAKQWTEDLPPNTRVRAQQLMQQVGDEVFFKHFMVPVGEGEYARNQQMWGALTQGTEVPLPKGSASWRDKQAPQRAEAQRRKTKIEHVEQRQQSDTARQQAEQLHQENLEKGRQFDAERAARSKALYSRLNQSQADIREASTRHKQVMQSAGAAEAAQFSQLNDRLDQRIADLKQKNAPSPITDPVTPVDPQVLAADNTPVRKAVAQLQSQGVVRG